MDNAFFQTIPKPLKQYTLFKKKIIHSALPSGFSGLYSLQLGETGSGGAGLRLGEFSESEIGI